MSKSFFSLTRTFGGVAKDMITAFATSCIWRDLKSAGDRSIEISLISANMSVTTGPGLTL